MRRISILVLAAVAASLGASAAFAQSHEIEVRKHQSFLEPSNVAPVGTQNLYAVDSTRLNYDAPGGAARRDDLKQGLLPKPGDPIGWAPR
jgi:hypothetical protein